MSKLSKIEARKAEEARQKAWEQAVLDAVANLNAAQDVADYRKAQDS